MSWFIPQYGSGRRGHDSMIVRFTTVQSVPITTKVMTSSFAQATLCDKVCQLLATGRWFVRALQFSPPIK